MEATGADYNYSYDSPYEAWNIEDTKSSGVLKFECNCRTEEEFTEMMDSVHNAENGVNFEVGARLWYRPEGTNDIIMVEHQISTRTAALALNEDDPEWDGLNEPDWLTAYEVDDEFDDDVSQEIFTETIEDNITLHCLKDEMREFAQRVFDRFYVKEPVALDEQIQSAKASKNDTQNVGYKKEKSFEL